MGIKYLGRYKEEMEEAQGRKRMLDHFFGLGTGDLKTLRPSIMDGYMT